MVQQVLRYRSLMIRLMQAILSMTDIYVEKGTTDETLLNRILTL